MQNKKLILIMGILVLLVGGAAFVAGRMLNQKVSPAGAGGPPEVPIIPFRSNLFQPKNFPKLRLK